MAGQRSKDVDAYVQALPKEQRPIVEALRDFILSGAPHLEEKVKWGNPTYIGKTNVCWILAYRDHVDFGFFRGAVLPDPQGVLEGTGKGLRHVKIYTIEDVKRKPLKPLMTAALRLDGK
ncbi:MAG TPA: DUF1801 domain-containing protein [Thermoplasmata archaeon]|jgi:hypothetical protein